MIHSPFLNEAIAYLTLDIQKNGCTQKIIEYCQKHLISFSEHPDALLLSAQLAEKCRQTELAINLCKQAVAKTGGQSFYLQKLRNLLARQGLSDDIDFLRPADFLTFFERLADVVIPMDYSSAPRYIPNFETISDTYFLSTFYEESLFERGVYMAHAKNLEVFFRRRVCPNIISKYNFLIEKSHEIPPKGEGMGVTEHINYPYGFGAYSYHFGIFDIFFSRNGLKKYFIEEEAIYIGGVNNYGHLLLDYFPKLFSVERLGLTSLPVYTYPLTDFFHEIATALFPQFRFVDLYKICDYDCLVQFRTVYVPSYVPAGIAFPLLRKRIDEFEKSIAFYNKLNKGLSINSPSWERIYLSRGPKLCRIENETEIIKLLENRGFCTINSMECTFIELINIFRYARIIVSASGAQLSTMIFSGPGAIIVELTTEEAGGKGSLWNGRVYAYSQVEHRILVGKTVHSSSDSGVYNSIGYFDPEALLALLPVN